MERVPRSQCGPPPKLCVPEEVEEQIANYFQWCDDNPITISKLTPKGQVFGQVDRPYTIEGLALALDVSKQSLWKYANGKVTNAIYEVVEMIRKALARVHARMMELGLVGALDSRLVGLIAKYNLNYRDEKDDSNNGEGEGLKRDEILQRNIEEALRQQGKSMNPEVNDNE